MKPRRSGPARAAALAAVLAVLVSLAVQPSLSPAVHAMGPLPVCRYVDILTSPRQYGDWPVTLVDTILRVPDAYVPPDLASVSQAGIAGSGKVRTVLIEDLRAMTEAAEAAGAAIGVVSAYRSYEKQQTVFRNWVNRYGYARAVQISARPGHSEHQLGLGIDFRSEPRDPTTLTTDWATTLAGNWMKAHAWEYGFVMSYPKGKMDVACYDYEPWHYRYVGRDNAAAIHESGVTPREWLWANFTTTVVPGKTVKPGASALPVETPVATPPASAPASAPTLPPNPSATVPTSPSAPATVPPATPPPPVGSAGADMDGPVLAGLAIMLVAALLALLGIWASAVRRAGPRAG